MNDDYRDKHFPRVHGSFAIGWCLLSFLLLLEEHKNTCESLQELNLDSFIKVIVIVGAMFMLAGIVIYNRIATHYHDDYGFLGISLADFKLRYYRPYLYAVVVIGLMSLCFKILC